MRAPGRTFVRILVLACSVLLAPFAAESARAEQQELVVDTVFANPGQPVELPVLYSGNPPIVALQLDLTFDETILTFEGTSPGAAVVDHGADGASPEGGLVRIVLHSPLNQGLGEGEALLVTFSVAADAPLEFVPVDLSAVVMSDEPGDAVLPTLLESGGIEVTDSNCLAPLDLVLTDETIDFTFVYEACNSITATNVRIVPPGDVTFRTAGEVILGDGFSVEDEAKFTVETDAPLFESFAEEHDER